MKIHSIRSLILLFLPSVCFAQSSSELGILPTININKKLQRDWSVNFKTESRQSLIKDDFRYDYLLTDLSIAAAKKTGINSSIAVGYLLRIDEKGIRNRAIQQVTLLKRYPDFILAHRFSADQTFQKDTRMEWRFRYRISAEFPLSGQSVDPKEFFLKFSSEYLNSLQGKEYDLEIRSAGFIGYVITPKNKLELGLDYRIDSFIAKNPRNRFWIGMNFYQSI